MNPRLLRATRIVELIGGVGVLLLGLCAWILTLGYELNSESVMLFLFLVAPGMALVAGSCIQMIFHKLWALALLFAGAAVTVWACLIAVSFFGYSGYAWGVRAVFTDIFLVFITLIAALVAAVPDVRKIFSPDGVEQIVGRERRECVSHQAWRGEG
jgi:hypothetical protein